MTFDATYSGRVYANDNSVTYLFDGKVFYGSGTQGYRSRVILTGYYAKSERGSIGYQTTSGHYIIMSDGWEMVGTAPVNKYSETQAQALVNQIINNNKIIVANNLLCARFANKLTPEQQTQLRGLQTRLQARNEALMVEGLVKDVQTSYPAGYAELSAYLDAFMAGETIGLATWATIVIIAVVAAGMGTAAYFAYKAFADESERDVKYSKDLTKVLTSKLTPEEYQQLLDETKGIVTKARIKQSLSSYNTLLKVAAMGVLVYFGYRVIKNRF